jgi:hypothetical protein
VGSAGCAPLIVTTALAMLEAPVKCERARITRVAHERVWSSPCLAYLIKTDREVQGARQQALQEHPHATQLHPRPSMISLGEHQNGLKE